MAAIALAAAASWVKRAELSRLPRAPAAAALLLAVLSGVFAAERHRGPLVYFDEFEHVNIAQNLARLGAFGESLAGGAPDLDVLDRPTWPGGAHVLWSLAYRAGATSERAASGLNLALASASVFLLFLIGSWAFADSGAGLLAAATWAFLPLRVEFAATTDLTAPSTFWLAASLLSVLAFARAQSRALRALAILVPCYAAHVRFENALLLGLIAVPGTLDRSRVIKSGVPVIAAAVPLAILVWLNRAQSLPGFTSGLGASAGNLLANAGGNAWFLLKSPAGPLLLLGIYAARRIEKARVLALLGLLYLLVFSSFYRGDFGAGTERRYALSVFLPLILAASSGLSRLAPGRAGAALALVAVAGGMLWPGRQEARAGGYAEEERLARAGAELLPPGTTVVAYSVPFMMAASARPAVSPYLLLDPESPAAKKALASPALALWKDQWWSRRAGDSKKVEELLKARFEFSDQERGFVILRRKKGA